jgi:hypothetical protein
MKCCDDIVELNAEAAILLQRNESKQAKRLLAHALRTIQPIFDAASKVKSSPRTFQCNVNLNWYTCCINSHSFVGHSPELLERYEANPVFSRLFLVKGINAAPAVKVMAAVLLYNIGLILHLESFQTGQSCLLRRASEFYNQSLTIVNTAAAPMHPELAFLAAAIYHNLLHCYRGLCQSDLTRASAERLANVLQWFETSSRTITFGDYEFFQSCLFFTRQHDLCHAGAA